MAGMWLRGFPSMHDASIESRGGALGHARKRWWAALGRCFTPLTDSSFGTCASQAVGV